MELEGCEYRVYKGTGKGESETEQCKANKGREKAELKENWQKYPKS